MDAKRESIGSAVRPAEKIRKALKTENAVVIAEYAARFALSFLLARARILGNINPFAMGLVAASPVGTAGIVTLLGASLGYIASGGFLWYLKYLCMGLLIYSSMYVFRETRLIRMLWFPALCAAAISLCIGFVYAADAGFSFASVSGCMLESGLIFATSYLYRSALSPWGADRGGYTREMLHAVSVLALAATLAVCLAGVRLFGLISIGRIITALLVLLVAYKGGIGYGCACGVICGVAADLAVNGAPHFGTVYTLAALSGGIFSKHGRLTCTVAFTLANAAGVLWTWQSFPSPAGLYEVFVASVIFMLLPASVPARAGALFPSVSGGYGVLKAREYTKTRAEMTAAVFAELCDAVKLTPTVESDDDAAALVFDRAAESVCRKCAMASRCWKRDKEATVSMLSALAPEMLKNGRLDVSVFPTEFAEGCRNIDALTSAVNEELRARVYRTQYKNRLRASSDSARSQYSDIAAILRDLANELGGETVFEPALERKLHRYLMSMDIDASAAVFRSRGGRLHVEITGAGMNHVRREDAYLDKLSAVLGVRLCTPVAQNSSSRLVLLEAEPLTVSVGIASAKKRGQTSSGDSATYFKTDDGILYIILSDGMGTGDDAANYSNRAVIILEKFLRAGVSPDTALNILNNVMLIKNEGETAFATVDLMCINLFTGDTSIFKYGSAPTYVRKGGSVRRIKSERLAAGLSPSGKSTECTKLRLCAAEGAAVVSDGVISGGDGWLAEALASFDGSDTRELARQLVKTASSKFGNDDDMTAIALYVENRV